MRPLKVHFSNVDFSSRTGPNTFARRLAIQLSYDGHIVADADDFDVELAFIESRLPRLGRTVQRLDGIWFKPNEFYAKNAGIKRLYTTCDHVVFQSEFDRKLVEKWWGPARSCSVIRNGIELKDVSPDEKMLRLRKEFDTIFVCSANWHPQKRLSENIRLFKHLQATSCPKSCLIILGNHPDVIVSDPSVFYAGSQPHDVCLQLYALADYMIHLAWLDHCPNVVVEALSVGTPVICTDAGGTCELVGDSGIVIKEAPFDFELTDYDSPPQVDFSSVVLPESKPIVDRSRVDITHISQQYVEVFRKVVKCEN